MSMELDAVIDSCVQMLLSDPHRSREEIAQMLTRWEDMGYISRQMRALIVQRLRKSMQDGSGSLPSEDAQDQTSPH